jgi:hypothetical protein
MKKLMRRLLRDDSGNAVTEGLSFSPTWFIVFGVFLMNVQLGRTYEQRDMVDHAAAVAADAVMKNVCDTAPGSAAGSLDGRSMEAVDTAIQPLFELVSSAKNPCRVSAQATGSGSSTSGGRELEVSVVCRFPCTVPLASRVMCTDGYVTFSAKQKTIAMGCDAT